MRRTTQGIAQAAIALAGGAWQWGVFRASPEPQGALSVSSPATGEIGAGAREFFA